MTRADKNIKNEYITFFYYKSLIPFECKIHLLFHKIFPYHQFEK